ncbi:hypothetical protein [Desulfosporosinus youngiae]|uniref:Uncharacterized protein n=1 Tax=Desulfosporosinus youngiae DSM 17734 TaxID=768710 RepID=H5XZS1_9FIRM|nr:hypothetical protein [Desulfosporosinus youngiae]EHQ92117.1 hypothetical protein DesyoDRAFT_5186 [Desulfosporosinus youngiae DSM 17734]
MNEKIMHLANFNITFGEKAEPMLSHFKDIIFPAFTSGIMRGKVDEIPHFLFTDVEIKQIKGGEYILVGNYIKETEYTIHTTVTNGALTASPAKHPTAPYSRFIIFLKNHRMILVRNESVSPDIRSFQATVRYILNKYTREANKEQRENKRKPTTTLPNALVNIVDMPLKEDINAVLKSVQKIKWVKLNFFPLNNDFGKRPIANSIRAEMKSLGSNTTNLTFNSPDSKEGIQKLLEETSGQARTTLFVKNKDGEDEKIREDSFSSNKKIAFAKDVTSDDDEYFVLIAQKESIIKNVSKENEAWYKRYVAALRSLL